MTAQPGLRTARGPDAGAGHPSEAARASTRAGSRRRGSGMDRKPKVALVVTVVFFALLYLPIVAVVVFSFNTKKSLTVFDGWSLQWYSAFFHDSELTHSLGTSIEVAAVAMVGSVIIGTGLAFGLVRARSRLGGAANLIMLIPLVTPEIVTGVASLMLFKGVYLQPGLATLMIAETTFSISYVTVILRARVAELNPEVEEAAMDLGATRAQAVRLVTLPLLWPAILSAAILIFTLVFDDFVLAFFTSGVTPQPLSVRIYSAIRFGVQPSINAVGTLMLVGSLVLIALALLLPRLLGRRTSALDLFN
jgi:spermidine/putrescine transport system permease protein